QDLQGCRWASQMSGFGGEAEILYSTGFDPQQTLGGLKSRSASARRTEVCYPFDRGRCQRPVSGELSAGDARLSRISRDRRPVMQSTQSRRCFISTLSSVGAASLVGARHSFAQERPPETTTVRLAKIPGICIAPQYVAEDLLRAEGFTDIRYLATNPGIPAALSLARGEVDFTANYAPTFVIPIDAGEPITIVGGEHIGCFELFAREGIRNIPDLKG